MKQRDDPPGPQQVYLFGTCLVDLFVAQAGLDAVRLLEREGLTVHFPQGQSCCGQPAYTSGNPEQARAVARAQLAHPFAYRLFRWAATRLRALTPARQMGWTRHRTPLKPAARSLADLLRARGQPE